MSNDTDYGKVSPIKLSLKCSKIKQAANIAAYIKKEKLERDTQVLKCDKLLIQNVISNYIIVKNIIKTLPWQEKLLCQYVCTTWHSAVQALQKEQLFPEDFVIDLYACSKKGGNKYKLLGNFYIEPLAVFTFSTLTAFDASSRCTNILPSPCTPPCEENHCLVDVVHQQTTRPKECNLIVRAVYLSYMPLPQSISYKYTIKHSQLYSTSFLGGVYIPVIPNVKFQIMNIKSDSNMKTEFFDELSKIARNNIFKGVLVYITDKYLLRGVEDIVCLNYFDEIQPEIPYALGGCLIEDTMCGLNDVEQFVASMSSNNKDFVTENLMTVGLFTIPKTSKVATQEEGNIDFEMYSLVVESSVWNKSKIQHTITEFSTAIAHHEHSVCLKLSCVGRDHKHEWEQDCFRAVFPNTRLIGCYGNGELGINHPERPCEDSPRAAKRHRSDSEPQFGVMYSYSSVFVYIGWGKIIKDKQNK